MNKTDNMPMWVYLAVSSLGTRRGALFLIWSCVVCSIYCIPWPLYFADQGWVAKIFLIKNWTWFVMMVPMALWYWLSMRWVDKHATWEDAGPDKGDASVK